MTVFTETCMETLSYVDKELLQNAEVINWSPILKAHGAVDTRSWEVSSICTHHYIQDIEKYRVRYFYRLSPTTIAWSIFRSISSIDRLHHPPLFFLWLAASASLHGMPCAMPPWAHRALLVIRLRLLCSYLSIIEFWWLHLDQYTLKVIDFYLRTNLNFLCCLLRIGVSIELYRLDVSFILSTRVLNEHHQLWY